MERDMDKIIDDFLGQQVKIYFGKDIGSLKKMMKEVKTQLKTIETKKPEEVSKILDLDSFDKIDIDEIPNYKSFLIKYNDQLRSYYKALIERELTIIDVNGEKSIDNYLTGSGVIGIQTNDREFVSGSEGISVKQKKVYQINTYVLSRKGGLIIKEKVEELTLDEIREQYVGTIVLSEKPLEETKKTLEHLI